MSERVAIDRVRRDFKSGRGWVTERIEGFDRSIHSCDVVNCRLVPRIRWLPAYRNYWWDLCNVHFQQAVS